MKYHYIPLSGTLYIPRPKGMPRQLWQHKFTGRQGSTCWDELQSYVDHLSTPLVDLEARIRTQSLRGDGIDENLLLRAEFLRRVIGRYEIVLKHRPSTRKDLRLYVEENRNAIRSAAKHIKADRKRGKKVEAETETLRKEVQQVKAAFIQRDRTLQNVCQRIAELQSEVGRQQVTHSPYAQRTPPKLSDTAGFPAAIDVSFSKRQTLILNSDDTEKFRGFG
ncbi:MAG: hypothetical protein AAF609_22395 [Cyanobacteria bacterium P01_C01_bin.120]